MMNQKNEYLNQWKHSDLISVMRGFSIAAIMLYHLICSTKYIPDVIKTASKFGGAGVHIFFFASGFGLALSQIRKPLSIGQFLKKRFCLVYVPYILVVSLSFLLPFAYEASDKLTALLSHVFLFKMFSPRYIESFSVPFWYMSTLFQFYLIFPLLIRLKERLGSKRFFVGSCATSLLWAIVTVLLGVGHIRVWGSFFLQYLWEFSLGICMAERFHKDPENWIPKFRTYRLMLVVGVFFTIYAMMSLEGGLWENFNDFFSAASFGGICLLLYRIKWLRVFARFMDSISFELYLLHALIFAAFRYVLGMSHIDPIMAVCAVFCAVIAADMYHRLVKTMIKAWWK